MSTTKASDVPKVAGSPKRAGSGPTSLARVGGLVRRFSMVAVLVVVVIVMTAADPTFISATNLTNLLQQISVFALIGIGELFVIICADIDLSNASVIAAAGVSYAAVAGHHNLWLAGVVAVLIGAGIGIVNGVITVVGRIQSFVTTLGTLTAVEGIVLVTTGGQPIYNVPADFVSLGSGSWLGLPIPIYIVVVCALGAWYLLAQRPFGRHVYAVGGNRVAAEVSGISAKRVRIAAFVIAGTLAALAGIIYASRTGTGDPTMGSGYELDAIAAVVIGGGDLMGGYGNVLGTMIGVLILGVISNGLNILGVSAFWQQVAVGAIIVAAVLLGRVTSGGERAPV